MADTHQHERECEDAATGGLTPGTTDWCSITGDPGKPCLVTQNPVRARRPGQLQSVRGAYPRQYGEEGLGPGDAGRLQRGQFLHRPDLTQSTDAGSNVTNHVAGDCTTDGSCTAGQTTTINGAPTQDGYTSPTIPSLKIDCLTNPTVSCQATPPPVPTIIAPTPSNPTDSHAATFNFNDNPATAGFTFQCSIDGGGYSPCHSGAADATYSGLGTGSHTFRVEAVDTTNSLNVSAPASFMWTVVEANISISPAANVNEVGGSHTFTVTVLKDLGGGAGLTTPAVGETVTTKIVNSNGATSSMTGGTCGAATGTTGSGLTDTAGTCTIKINGPTAGTVKAFAYVSVHFTGLTVQRDSDSATASVGHGPGGTDEATKTWVDAYIQISPLTASNEVGTNHVLTVTVKTNDGSGSGYQPASGVSVTASLTNSNGATADFVLTGANSCTTGASGTCTVTIKSPAAGQTTINAATSGLTVGGVALSRATGDTKSQDSLDATKTWVDAYIQISPLTASNEVGTNHVLTVTVKTNDGSGSGYQPASGVSVTASLTNSNGATADFVLTGANSCTTGASGTCTVTIKSPAAGQTTINAATSGLTVGGVALSRATGDTKSQDSLDATKTWWTYIQISPLTASNEVGTNHVLTVTVKTNDGSGSGYQPASGVSVTASLTNSNGATADFVLTGANSCTTGASGTCTVTIKSPAAGQTTINAATSGLTVGGVALSRATGDTKSQDSLDATRPGWMRGSRSGPRERTRLVIRPRTR